VVRGPGQGSGPSVLANREPYRVAELENRLVFFLRCCAVACHGAGSMNRITELSEVETNSS
jgi:hypothetical protein